MTPAPCLPPLLTGEAVAAAADPFERARALAALGCDGGTVVHNLAPDRLRAAMVFAPEVPLETAMIMLPICGIGLQNALGALAPPEVAVHLGWNGTVRVNGARCGHLRVAASATDPSARPDWLVIGLDLPFRWQRGEPGRDPSVTVLLEEGCAGITPLSLLEGWARHTLVWINRWQDAGAAPIHAEWMGLAWDMGETVRQNGVRGRFLGVDERFGMLLRDGRGGATTRLIPLTTLLKEPR